MLRLIVAVVITVIVSPLYGQNADKYKTDSVKVFGTALEIFHIQSDTSEFTKVLPLKYIHVYDSRVDTSYWCLFQRKYLNVLGINKVESQRMTLAGGFSEDYTSYLQEYFAGQLNSGETGGLHCFLKRCRVYATDTISDAVSSSRNVLVNVGIEMECYYQKGANCYPAMRIDTGFGLELTVATGAGMATEVVDELTDALSRKLNTLDFSRIVNRKAYTEQEMRNRYAERYNAVPLLQRKTFKKGIYKTFEEWQLNQPSLPGQFTIEKERKKLFTLWDAEKNIIPVHKIFGVSDGEHFWIQSMGNLFPLIPVHNNWEFYGVAVSQRVNAHTPRVSGAGNLTGNAVQGGMGLGVIAGLAAMEAAAANPVLYCLHGIDLETGLIY